MIVGRTCDSFLNLCLYELWLLVCKYNVDLRVLHIKGKDNVLVDVLSRNKVEKVGDVTWGIMVDTLLSMSL